MFDSYSLLFLLFDGFLGLGGIFFVVHYLFKKQGVSTLLPPNIVTDSAQIEALRQECLRLRAQQQSADTDVFQTHSADGRR